MHVSWSVHAILVQVMSDNHVGDILYQWPSLMHIHIILWIQQLYLRSTQYTNILLYMINVYSKHRYV